MSLRGSCQCNNFQITWYTRDYSLVPRACQCDYCRTRGAAWVSKSGTAVQVRVRNPRLHRVARHGSGNARFHECANCGDSVVVTARIDGDEYGVLNASCLSNPMGFADSVKTDFAGQSAEEKRDRWRQNWCCPVSIPAPAEADPPAEA